MYDFQQSCKPEGLRCSKLFRTSISISQRSNVLQSTLKQDWRGYAAMLRKPQNLRLRFYNSKYPMFFSAHLKISLSYLQKSQKKLKCLTRPFLFCCVCINNTHFPEEQSNEHQQKKSTNTASYDNRQEVKHFVFQEDKSNLE